MVGITNVIAVNAGGGGGTGGSTSSTAPSLVRMTSYPVQTFDWCEFLNLCPAAPGCEFGLCIPMTNPWTGQVGVSGGWTFPWGINVNFFGGIAIDLAGHVAIYWGGGGGAAAGAKGSAGIQVGISNAYTVCGLRGPFGNASGTFGVAGVAGTADVFHGPGRGPGGKVTGGGITVGVGGGASASMGGTTTKVTPLGNYSCN
jgi:hypothetical protein